MSRIGKQPVAIPEGVEVKIDGQTVTVKGAKGELTRTFSKIITITQEGNEIIVTRPDDSREARSLHGLTRTLINNMIIGCNEGFAKKLQMVGYVSARLQQDSILGKQGTVIKGHEFHFSTDQSAYSGSEI